MERTVTGGFAVGVQPGFFAEKRLLKTAGQRLKPILTGMTQQPLERFCLLYRYQKNPLSTA